MKLVFPESILSQHLVVLGKTGAGKSSALRHVVEHLLKSGRRVCVTDPKGDWWGLKWSSNGKDEGFPVILFGDFKEPKAADVPINPHSGAHVAELIATGNRPCVIGFRGWTTADMVRFWIDFASTLFAKNAGELFLVGDEFHNFAPKGKIMDPQAGKCLHWSNRLLSEGRGLGLVCLLASQRPQKVHNDTLTSCETLVAMRVVHSADRNAVQDWIEGCGDVAMGKEVLNSLAGLPRGEAYVWSPEVGFGPSRVKFPMFESFDSFAPPQLQKKVSGSGWAHVDLDAVKQKLARVIEEAKANDPSELKRIIADLKRKLADAERKQPEVKRSEPIQIPVFDAACRQLLEKTGQVCGELLEETRRRADDLGELNRWLQNTNVRLSEKEAHRPDLKKVILNSNPPATRMPRPESNGSGLGKCEQAILAVLINHGPCAIGKLALLSGYRQSGSFKNALSELRTSGLISGDNSTQMCVTHEGTAMGPFPRIQIGLDYWSTHPSFGVCERAIINTLAKSEPLDIDTLCVASGYGSPPSGSFKNALSNLRTAGVLIGKNNDRMRLSEQLNV